MKKLTIITIIIFGFISATSQPCLPEGIVFTTQSQIDSFQINYPGCTEIEGDVFITGEDIVSLNGLSVLTSIGGDLEISHLDSLHSLAGLENLTHINGNLHFSWLSLDNLTGLNGLTSIGGGLLFNRIDSLQDLSGLENLNTIGGSLTIGTLYAASSGGTSLTSLNGLEGLDSIYGGMGLSGNALTDISAIDELDYLGGHLLIQKNHSLSACESDWICNYLQSPNGPVTIQGNAPGCNSVFEVVVMCGDSIPCLPFGNYIFVSQEDIDNFQDLFPGCSDLEGDLAIGFIPLLSKSIGLSLSSNISNLDGLNGINSIGGSLIIYSNDSLLNLNGLSSLTLIGSSSPDPLLSIQSNDLLTTLSGLENIELGAVEHLYISSNSSLSNCEVESICAYLANPNGTVTISSNTIGCNSPEEVQDSCEANAVYVDEQYIKDKLMLYPNPANQELNISVEGFTINELVIYTLSGQQVFHERLVNGTVDVSHFRPGMYIIEVSAEGRKVRQKLLVQR